MNCRVTFIDFIKQFLFNIILLVQSHHCSNLSGYPIHIQDCIKVCKSQWEHILCVLCSSAECQWAHMAQSQWNSSWEVEDFHFTSRVPVDG